MSSTNLKSRLGNLNKHLNFFRCHLLFFTFTPLIASLILYAANGDVSGNARNGAILGRQKVEYIDALFLCYSAMTVTGLVTVNLSALHPFQQVIMLTLFIIGDVSIVSLIMVLVRKRFFRKHCEQLLRNTNALPRTRTFFDRPISGPKDGRALGGFVEGEEVAASPTDFRHDLPEEGSSSEGHGSTTAGYSAVLPPDPDSVSLRLPAEAVTSGSPRQSRERAVQIADPPITPYHARQGLRAQTRRMSMTQPSLLRSTTVQGLARSGTGIVKAATAPVTYIPLPNHSRHTGLGGFPSPYQLLDHVLPSAKHTLRRRLARVEHKLTLVTNPTIPVEREVAHEELWGSSMKGRVGRWMPEGLGGLVIGRNSRFFSEELDDEELEAVGGVEYRALRLLSYLVPAYIVLFQLVPFAIIAIYYSKSSRWDSVFEASSGVQANTVNKTWWALFLTCGAYTGSGMSLVDQNMAPFSKSYLLIFSLVVVMLAGNHALPIMLRFIIWLGTKIWRKGRTHETLHFLLDHPRRCFLYLFPSHQTWYLLFILIAFVVIELFSFLVLNINLPIVSSLGGFQMFSDALLQSLSVRAAGFGIVPIASLAPSILFLYIILMYVAIYPIAMSVRSTNVYEERALGVYEPEDPDMSSDAEPAFQGKRHEVFSKYLSWHIRKQLAFDIWPLCLAVFFILIAERGKLLDSSTASWFTIFRVIFECTSAYSTIGLTMGSPAGNWGFSAEFGTFSKLIVILVMLRGRHRGLPVAIDRAVLLPHEYSRIDKRNAESEQNVNGTGQLFGGLSKEKAV